MGEQAITKDLEVIPVACRFYGYNGMFGRLVPTGGNQCGLILTSHSPCQMEMQGRPVDEMHCPLVLQFVNDEATQRTSECPPACGHSAAQHVAFDVGFIMGQHGLDRCPFDQGALRTQWLIGHWVGKSNQSRSHNQEAPQ